MRPSDNKSPLWETRVLFFPLIVVPLSSMFLIHQILSRCKISPHPAIFDTPLGQLPTYSLTLTRSLTQSLTRSLHSRSLVTLPICSSDTPPSFSTLCRPCKYTHAHLISIRFALLGLVTPSSFSSPPPLPSPSYHCQPMSRIFVYY